MEVRGRGRLFSYGLAASVTFIWSVTFVSTKYLLGWLEPGEILLYRVAVAYALFVAFSPRPLPRAGLREELRFAAAGLLGVTLYFLCENTALSYSTASNVALIGGTAPLITGIAAHFFTKNEKLSRAFAAGSVLCLAGIFLIICNGHFVLKLNPLGDIIALSGACVFAAYTLVVKGVGAVYTPVQIVRKMLFYTLLSLIALAATPVIDLHAAQLARPRGCREYSFPRRFRLGLLHVGVEHCDMEPRRREGEQPDLHHAAADDALFRARARRAHNALRSSRRRADTQRRVYFAENREKTKRAAAAGGIIRTARGCVLMTWNRIISIRAPQARFSSLRVSGIYKF